MIKSEHTKNMTDSELAELQAKVADMTPEELRRYRNSHDPDSMGFCGEEGDC